LSACRTYFDLENGAEPFATAIRRLADADAAGIASVQVAASIASENQPGGSELNDFGVFRKRLAAVGMGHLELCLPLLMTDMGFWDEALWGGPGDTELLGSIHEALHPGVPASFADFCSENGIDPSQGVGAAARKWHNATCDVLALHSHIKVGRDVFVSNDKNFRTGQRLPKLIQLGAGRIEGSIGAAELLPT